MLGLLDLRKMTSRGDTVMEVIIALAVIGVVISAVYASASKSLTTARSSQERVEALMVAEGQVEQLRSLPAPGALSLPCLVGGVASSACSSGIYNIAITHPAPTTNVFMVKVSWNGVGSLGKQDLKLTYTAY